MYGKYRKIPKFQADATSFIYFPQSNTSESNISSSVLKIQNKFLKNNSSENFSNFWALETTLGNMEILKIFRFFFQ